MNRAEWRKANKEKINIRKRELRANKPKFELSYNYLISVLAYNPDTGSFTWIKGPRKGKIAGSLHIVKSRNLVLSYIRLSINDRKYMGHRVAWLYMTKVWPDAALEIDHIDHDGTNNKWNNLRLSTPSQNQYNKRIGNNNTSGFKGICPVGNKWQAYIYYEYKQLYLGVYDSIEEAKAIVDAKRREIHGEFAHE